MFTFIICRFLKTDNHDMKGGFLAAAMLIDVWFIMFLLLE